MATGVARGGTLSWSAIAPSPGHRRRDGRGRAGAGLRRGRARGLDPGQWQPIAAEERPRPQAGTGVDTVIRARRHT